MTNDCVVEVVIIKPVDMPKGILQLQGVFSDVEPGGDYSTAPEVVTLTALPKDTEEVKKLLRVVEMYRANEGGPIDQAEQEGNFADEPELLETAWPLSSYGCPMTLTSFTLRYYDDKGQAFEVEVKLRMAQSPGQDLSAQA